MLIDNSVPTSCILWLIHGFIRGTADFKRARIEERIEKFDKCLLVANTRWPYSKRDSLVLFDAIVVPRRSIKTLARLLHFFYLFFLQWNSSQSIWFTATFCPNAGVTRVEGKSLDFQAVPFNVILSETRMTLNTSPEFLLELLLESMLDFITI